MAKSLQFNDLFSSLQEQGSSSAAAKKTTKVRMDLEDGDWEMDGDEVFSSVAMERLKLCQSKFNQNETAKVSDFLQELDETFHTCSNTSKVLI